MKQRVIKFRALRDDVSDCSFVYGSLCYSEGGHPRIHTGFDLAGFPLWTTCLKGTEGQFTGLQDKNGNDIYEGDVLRYGSSPLYEVRFNASAWSVICKTQNGTAALTLNDRTKIFEVIGNIYENPELLPTNTTEG